MCTAHLLKSRPSRWLFVLAALLFQFVLHGSASAQADQTVRPYMWRVAEFYPDDPRIFYDSLLSPQQAIGIIERRYGIYLAPIANAFQSACADPEPSVRHYFCAPFHHTERIDPPEPQIRGRAAYSFVPYFSCPPSGVFGGEATYSSQVYCTPGTPVIRPGVWYAGFVAAYCPDGFTDNGFACLRVEPPKDQSCLTAHPVSPGTGAKWKTETDYIGAGAHPLSFYRTYRSDQLGRSGLALGWMHNWGRNIESMPRGTEGTVYVTREDGQHAVYVFDGTQWKARTNNSFDVLTELNDSAGNRVGWSLRLWADDSTETYNASGQLLKVVQRNGWTNTLTYSTATTDKSIAPYPGLLISVSNHFGRQLQFRYNENNGSMSQLIDPAGGVIQYSIDSLLTKITWQDGTSRQYLYEGYNLLTGIIDETGTRIGTFSYHPDGKVASSELANGAEKLTFSYSPLSTQITTAATGKTVTQSYSTAQGTIRPTTTSAANPLCGNTAADTQYDANGNVTRRKEFDGTITRYVYDDNNREIHRVTAAGTTSAKHYLTRWHPTWNLPKLRIEPLKITAYHYDERGNLTGQAETATTDASGSAGANAVRDITQPMLTSGWHYDVNNLPLTVVSSTTAYGQSAVVTGKLRYIYNTLGDAVTVRELNSNETINSTYNSHGNITLARGGGKSIVSQYNSRGLIIQETKGMIRTNYGYTPWGDPSIITEYINATVNKTINYSYDPSHKLLNTTMIGPALSTSSISPKQIRQYGDDKTAKWVAYFSEKVDEIVSAALMCSPAYAEPNVAPDYSVCKQYGQMAFQSGCPYEKRAEGICYGDGNSWLNLGMSKAANILLSICTIGSNAVINNIRKCLVTEHAKARDDKSKKEKCRDCVKEEVIDDYHRGCFVANNLPAACYGGTYVSPYIFIK